MPMISTRRRGELFEHLLAIRHLRHGFGRDEADRIDVPETGFNQRRANSAL